MASNIGLQLFVYYSTPGLFWSASISLSLWCPGECYFWDGIGGHSLRMKVESKWNLYETSTATLAVLALLLYSYQLLFPHRHRATCLHFGCFFPLVFVLCACFSVPTLPQTFCYALANQSLQVYEFWSRVNKCSKVIFTIGGYLSKWQIHLQATNQTHWLCIYVIGNKHIQGLRLFPEHFRD